MEEERSQMNWKTCKYYIAPTHSWDVRGRCSWILDKADVDRINALMPPVYYVHEVPVSKAIMPKDCEDCKCYKEKEME